MWPLWLGTLKRGRCIAPGGGWKWWIFYRNFTRKLTGLKRVAPHFEMYHPWLSASCECLLSAAKMQRKTKTPKVSLRSHLIIPIFHPYKSTSQSFSQSSAKDRGSVCSEVSCRQIEETASEAARVWQPEPWDSGTWWWRNHLRWRSYEGIKFNQCSTCLYRSKLW